MSNSNVNIRELVLEILIEVMEKQKYSHLVLRMVLEKYQFLTKQERAFITRLTEGVIEHAIELDYIINEFSTTKTQKMKPLIRNLLRMSVYQIKYMDSVPDSAVCNEAVKIAKKRGFAKLGGFVNGVLRNISRKLSEVSYPQESTEPERYLEIKYSIPEWMIRQWNNDYGYEKTKTICSGFYKQQAISIRTNLTKTTPKDLKTKLENDGVKVCEVPLLPYAFDISNIDYLNSLDSFLQGEFYVQDISSMMVAEAAAPKKDDYIIDVCAAPGGKSTHIAELLDNTGMVEARDLTENKVALIEENLKRHGLTNMCAVQMDATIFDEASVNKADVLICDLPCSGLGVMGKKTDIRYKMTQEKMRDLVELQRKILNTVYTYLKPNGILVYSTCTINKEENEHNVEWFLETHKEFELVSMQQYYPGQETHDGFFVAKMKRRMA